MALIDIIALVIVLMSALWGLTRGLSRELLGLASWIAAAILATRWYAVLVPYLGHYLPGTLVADAAAFAATFIALMILFSILSSALSRSLRSTFLGGLDRALGFGFGLLRGGVVLAALYVGGSFFMHEDVWRSATEGSRLAPFIYQGATFLDSFLPVFMRSHLASPDRAGHDRDS